MPLTQEQYRMILECEDASLQVYANEPQLAFDVVPKADYLAPFNMYWFVAGRTVYSD